MVTQAVTYLVLLALQLSRAEPWKNYTGAQVLRLVPETESQVHYLQGLFNQDRYDFWTEPRAVGRPVDIMANVFQLPVLNETLSGLNLDFSIQLSNVGNLLEEIHNSLQRTRTSGPMTMDWTTYHRYDEIVSWMDSLAEDFPDLCTVEDVGLTYEGRTMKLMKIGTGSKNNPAIFIDGGIHAREWISPATVTYMVNKLVHKRDRYAHILNDVNFYVMPLVNPDGYEYSFSRDRLWRKTRSNTTSSIGCKGADPNRNWGHHWLETGASTNPCSDIYAGPEAFSEIEMKNVKRQILRLKDKLKVYMTFHSYSQLWLYPWGYSSDLPNDWRNMDTLAKSAVKALKGVRQTNYGVGSAATVLYAAAGGSDDWVKGVAGVKYVYTVELPDEGHYGFLLPEEEIIPTGKETFEALKVIANFVRDTYSNPQ